MVILYFLVNESQLSQDVISFPVAYFILSMLYHHLSLSLILFRILTWRKACWQKELLYLSPLVCASFFPHLIPGISIHFWVLVRTPTHKPHPVMWPYGQCVEFVFGGVGSGTWVSREKASPDVLDTREEEVPSSWNVLSCTLQAPASPDLPG